MLYLISDHYFITLGNLGKKLNKCYVLYFTKTHTQKERNTHTNIDNDLIIPQRFIIFYK